MDSSTKAALQGTTKLVSKSILMTVAISVNENLSSVIQKAEKDATIMYELFSKMGLPENHILHLVNPSKQ